MQNREFPPFCFPGAISWRNPPNKMTPFLNIPCFLMGNTQEWCRKKQARKQEFNCLRVFFRRWFALLSFPPRKAFFKKMQCVFRPRSRGIFMAIQSVIYPLWNFWSLLRFHHQINNQLQKHHTELKQSRSKETQVSACIRYSVILRAINAWEK